MFANGGGNGGGSDGSRERRNEKTTMCRRYVRGPSERLARRTLKTYAAAAAAGDGWTAVAVRRWRARLGRPATRQKRAEGFTRSFSGQARCVKKAAPRKTAVVGCGGAATARVPPSARTARGRVCVRHQAAGPGPCATGARLRSERRPSRRSRPKRCAALRSRRTESRTRGADRALSFRVAVGDTRSSALNECCRSVRPVFLFFLTGGQIAYYFTDFNPNRFLAKFERILEKVEFSIESGQKCFDIGQR